MALLLPAWEGLVAGPGLELVGTALSMSGKGCALAALRRVEAPLLRAQCTWTQRQQAALLFTTWARNPPAHATLPHVSVSTHLSLHTLAPCTPGRCCIIILLLLLRLLRPAIALGAAGEGFHGLGLARPTALRVRPFGT